MAGILLADLYSKIRESLFSNTSAQIKEIRKAWDKGKTTKLSDNSDAETCFRMWSQEGRPDASLIDDRTWGDLDLDAVFKSIDATQTKVGRNVLYSKLRFLGDPIQIQDESSSLLDAIETDTDFREKLQLSLLSLGRYPCTGIAKLLFGAVKQVRIPTLYTAIWFILCLSVLQMAIQSGGIFWALEVAVCVVNFFVCQWFEQKQGTLRDSYCGLYRLVVAANRIAREPLFSRCSIVVSLVAELPRLSTLKWGLYLSRFSQSSDSLVVGNIMYLVNLFTAFDLLAHSVGTATFRGNREFLQAVFKMVGEFDASIAITRYRMKYDKLSNACISGGGDITFEQVYHPLIPNAVANDFSNHGRSAIITGSNMAGKTSFIKTIGLNVILARTLGFCHAKRAVIPLRGVASSIKTSDSIRFGKSYHFSELERVLEFLGADFAEPRLLLIDEIFRGTNTAERIASSAAVLSELANLHTVLVTTHDIELVPMLKESYGALHFSETGDLHRPFDYVLREGVSRQRNAILLMERMGYPESVVEDAIDIVNNTRHIKTSSPLSAN